MTELDSSPPNSAPTSPRPFVFVVMPFDAALRDVYELGIRPACESAGAYTERVDEQIFQGSILQRIYNQIAKADLVVADMTGRNPNVFYEVGYAHALGKNVELLTREVDDIPFDLKHLPHTIYGNSIAGLRAALEPRIRWHLSHASPEVAPIAPQLATYFGGVRLSEGVVVDVPIHADTRTVELRADFGVTNESSTPYRKSDEDLALIVPRDLSFRLVDLDGDLISVGLPDRRTLHTFGPLSTMLPATWSTVRVDLEFSAPVLLGKSFPIVARQFTEFGPVDISFSIRFVQQAGTSIPAWDETTRGIHMPLRILSERG